MEKEKGNLKVSSIIQELRIRAKEEMEAITSYASTISWFKDAGLTGDIMERLQELYNDENMHLGSLLYIIGELDNNVVKQMEKGAKGD